MTRKLLIQLVIIAFSAVSFAAAQPKASPAQPARPDLRPGDKLEVVDRGRVRDAEFVEFTAVGLIKVRFDDDSQMSFRPTQVRFAKGINPREKPAANPPAGDEKPNTAARRKWTDATGMFSVEAEFVGLADGKVSLKKTDGKVIVLPLEKLTAADQAAAKLLAENATKPAAPKAPATATPGSSNEKVEFATYRETVTITEFSPQAPWDGRPDPQSDKMPELNPTRMLFQLGKEELTNNRAELDDINHHAWIMMKTPIATPQRFWFERIDLKTGERLTPVAATLFSDQLWSVSPSGRFATIGTPSEREVHIVDLSLAAPRKVRTIRPFHEQAIRLPSATNYGPDKLYDVKNAIFLDDDHLLVQDIDMRPALIDLKTLNVIYRLRTFGIATPSPGRKQMVMSTSDGNFLIEALTGKNLGMLDASGPQSFTATAFHPDGSRIAGATLSRAAVWNVATGKQEARQENKPVHALFRIAFGKDYDHLVAAGQNVFSMKTGKVVQSVPGNNIFPAFTHGGREWYLTMRQESETVMHVGVESKILPE